MISNALVSGNANVFTYTATLTTRIDDTAGFTLARGSDENSLLDTSGNLPVKSDGTAIDTGDVIALIDDDGQIDEDAIAETPLSMDALLSDLELTQNGMAIDLGPSAFVPARTTYTATVLSDVDEVVVATTASNSYATIRLVNNDADIASGSTATVVLNEAGMETEIELVVTAEAGGMPTTYTVAITARGRHCSYGCDD